MQPHSGSLEKMNSGDTNEFSLFLRTKMFEVQKFGMGWSKKYTIYFKYYFISLQSSPSLLLSVGLPSRVELPPPPPKKKNAEVSYDIAN